MLSTVVSILIVLIWPSTSQLIANLTDDTCLFNLGGLDFDLNPARKTSSDYKASQGQYEYVMNFCGLTVTPDGCQDRSGGCCQYSNGALEAAIFKADGSTPTAQLIDMANPNLGIIITHDNGDLCYQGGFMGPRHGILRLTCAAVSDSSFSISESPTCTHTIEMKLREACPEGFEPAGGEGGISGGTIFLIIFLVLFVFYCVGGFVFKTKKKGTTGKESIPNIDIWQQVPGLVKDGCQWTAMMIKTKGKGNNFYEEV